MSCDDVSRVLRVLESHGVGCSQACLPYSRTVILHRSPVTPDNVVDEYAYIRLRDVPSDRQHSTPLHLK